MPKRYVVPDRDPLQDPLMFLTGGALIPLCKVALFDAFWGDPGLFLEPNPKCVDRYFEYFEAECRLALAKWDKYELSELNFSHVTTVARMFEAGSTRPAIEQSLSETLVGDCRVIASDIIDLTVRLTLMVPIWSILQEVSPEASSLTWVEGTIERAFERHFRPKAPSKIYFEDFPVQQHVVLEKTFTARRLEVLAGMKIVWTSNLLDHLNLLPETKTVFIFHHAAFLHYQKDNHIYPAGLIHETLRTLAILLPRSERESKDWYLEQKISQKLDPEAVNCRPLSREERNIEKFDFWRERLANLKSAYDEAVPAQPKSLIRRYLSAINLKS